jgi:hypothetical protein
MVKLTLIMSLLIPSSLLSSPSVLGDRVLFEIDNNYFTQRQLEIHILVKEALRKRGLGDSFGLVSEKTWSQARETFIVDMLIHHEVQRFGSFLPTPDLTSKTLDYITKKNGKDRAYQAGVRRLGVQKEDLLTAVTNILQIEAYKKNKQGPGLQTEAGATYPPWIEEIRARVVVRDLKGSEAYQSIQPNSKTNR